MNDSDTASQRRLRRKHSVSDFNDHNRIESIPKSSKESHTKDIGTQPTTDRVDSTSTSASYTTAKEISTLKRINSPEDQDNQIVRHPPTTAEEETSTVPKTLDSTIRQIETLLNEAVRVAQAATEDSHETAGIEKSAEVARGEATTPSSFASLIRKYFGKPDLSIVRKTAAERVIRPNDADLAKYQPISYRNTNDHNPDTTLAIRSAMHKDDDTTPLTSSSLALPSPHLYQDYAFKRSYTHRIPPSLGEPVTPKTRSRSPTRNTVDQPSYSIIESAARNRLSNVLRQSPDDIAKLDQVVTPSLQLNGEDIKDDEGYNDDQPSPRMSQHSHFTQMFGVNSRHESMRMAHPEYSRAWDPSKHKQIDLPFDIDDSEIHITCNHAPIARNWSKARKRWSALIACLNASSIGLITGIYAGEVPAIQYVIIDLHHSIILGNVVLYLGLMFSSLLLWPLPLLHGRKPYAIGGLMLALSLQVPQGIAVIMTRFPDQTAFRVLLLLARGLSGIALGLCDINITATLLDVFGASLQSQNPYQEVVDPLDVRRHGGGMGLWLGILSWCSVGPLSIGFMIGASIISRATVDWGFWTSQMILVIVLILNVLGPEVRRSAFRRTLVEMIGPQGEFGRIARGEIKMHLKSRGPSWWGEEVAAGFQLIRIMLKQLGFFILSLYTAWVYAHFVLVLMLLGSLASTVYHLKPTQVGLCALSLGIGALLAIPFQKASWLSRARSHRPRTDSMTFQKAAAWSSHFLRRIVFTLALPISGIAFTVTSREPPFSIGIPSVMAAFVGFFSSLAVAECYGMLFETFDVSDLQPGMTGSPARKSVVQRYADQRTNFSCHPRIMAGISSIQALKYGLAAAATGLTGRVTRSVGVMQSTAVVAGILLGLTIPLTIVLIRWNTVQIIPEPKVRRDGSIWEPIILGKPSGITRKISILEAGKMTRWSEIRRRNRLESSLTGG